MSGIAVADEKLREPQHPIPAILRALQEESRVRAQSLRAAVSYETLIEQGRRFPKRSLAHALAAQSPAIIAEVKKASPSKGSFRDDFAPIALVKSYGAGGAAAISVVTEPARFQGQIGWIETIREMCDLPILRKDFIVDEIQIAESAAAGADAILLIARILDTDDLQRFSEAAAGASLEILYEAHDAHDLEKIRQLNPRLVGINARNLDNFVVDTESFETLFSSIPSNAVAVAESGLERATQIQKLVRIGYRGFLIGETLIRSADPARLIRELRGKN